MLDYKIILLITFILTGISLQCSARLSHEASLTTKWHQSQKKLDPFI